MMAAPYLFVACTVCGCGFTPEEWDLRHSADDGADIHEACCAQCGNPTPDDPTETPSSQILDTYALMDGMETNNTTTTIQRVHGWPLLADIDDWTFAAQAAGGLIKVAAPFVQHYHSDFIRDAQYLTIEVLPRLRQVAAHMNAGTQLAEVQYFYSADDCGTQLSDDQRVGHYRKDAQWTITFRLEHRSWGIRLEMEIVEVAR